MEYNYASPNFCSRCGATLRGGANPPPPFKATAEEKEGPPTISKLAYEVDYGAAKTTFGDVVRGEMAQPDAARAKATQKGKPKKRGRPPKRKIVDQEVILAQSLSQCKSARSNFKDVSGE